MGWREFVAARVEVSVSVLLMIGDELSEELESMTLGKKSDGSAREQNRRTVARRPVKLVKPVDNAIRIMRHLSISGRAHTLTRIARDLGINPSTCFNILRTLTAAHMIEFDLEGKILQANDAVSTLLGFRTDEVVEQSLSRFISPEETREFTAALREVVEKGVSRNVVLNPRSASGVL